MLLGAFIGLDDNGVQFSRLMANLLYTKDYFSFAKIFAATLQIPGVESKTNGTFNNEIGTIFYATRTGTATIPILSNQSLRKTYKLYSSIYFGCQMALNNEYKWLTVKIAGLSGLSYEMTKVSNAKDLEQVLAIYKNGEKISGMMETGAKFGFNACKNNSL